MAVLSDDSGKRLVPEDSGQFLSKYIPFLTKGLCSDCTEILCGRIRQLALGNMDMDSLSNGHCEDHKESTTDSSLTSLDRNSNSHSNGNYKNSHKGSSKVSSSKNEELDEMLISEVQNKRTSLSRDDRERIRLLQVGRKKDFVCVERVNGKMVNILQGLELHTRVFSAAEQNRIVDYVHSLQEMGRKNQLRERTYSEPRKWMRGKGRVTIQFGCCYNYAVDKNGNPPGIIRDEEVDPIPPLFKTMIKRMVRWHILPTTCVPNSCIVNIYDEGDCIPPHIDHHDFVRPFCTVSFLSECNILFGSNLRILGPGKFAGSFSIPLPVGSVLIMNGNGADVAKHSVPGVPAKRISITFRKMDTRKHPYKFLPDPELEGISPYDPNESLPQAPPSRPSELQFNHSAEGEGETDGNNFCYENSQFPPLGGSNSAVRPRNRR
ncbi:hypothetical protein AMTRI_Chr11g98830 [Amborella trichopoda]|uniref:Fe2OG dioxygenase domain-containing protein n=1 Tax=Amborella trichopoda TaxID=13333 RepID=W1PKR6_AMBTC|nr:uncharacterized protein LOC18436767 [Amborella trichopoda]ERN08633.1 hypothetical protein AMTR_s00017p00191520 [Amborella trichopoda]|eukprot:XP_006847052.1 uncharacterized protein LOC18436767 [Amborella trichopoda]